MSERNENMIKNGTGGKEMDFCKEEIKSIVCRKDLHPYFAHSDHSVNEVYFSEVPQICKDEPCQLGVDEAGRGPVLGPMVYGISYAPLSQKQLLVDLGCADSKSLTEKKRDEIFDDICKHKNNIGWAIDTISPNVIANSMYRRTKISLNEVSMMSATNLIQRAIESGVNVAEIYVDTVGKPESYQARLISVFPGVKIVVAKKADATYPIVSAASICAKVSRDHAIRAWRFREDQVFGFPQLVRFSWSTAEQILESKALTVEWEETEEMETPNEQKIFKFFAKSPVKLSNVHMKKHPFFTERCLSNATIL
ncbi:PREDICTED: ribonuclease H2 subunit A isoform X2 [Wasmannia auropunctata]|uniref:ribonuclease H2 subunit A isoform X2 n=1 Tax=Wasmannia auropunctata TaxID=64793 RepID=UPI0005EDB30E|nr:PREDICTED: ribonuclease H2 subunit A isoform X2 [Wasmannia auropunctata]